MPARPRGTDRARVIQVIETRSLRGIGTEDDMCREAIQYWDFDGSLLAEYDPCADQENESMKKRIADLEGQVQSQQDEERKAVRGYNPNIMLGKAPTY